MTLSQQITGHPIAQSQFLTILSRDEAWSRWIAALNLAPPGSETVPLNSALGRISAQRLVSPIDNPPFDRSSVDGFAVRAADVASASEHQPVTLRLNTETIVCGYAPRLAVEPGTATAIATGAPLPRGADAVVMVEWTEPVSDGRVAVRRPAAPGSFIGFAASDIARGETVLRAGMKIGPREIAMLAACGIAEIAVRRRPRVAVISTGDELVQPGRQLGPANIYDSNGPAIAAALVDIGCVPTLLPAVPDDAGPMASALSQALATHDALVISAGTSKGAGDLTYRLINALGAPGIIAHGVALKPGKPLCLAACDGKPVVALPGFPTSAMFTFQDLVAPALRMLAGLPAPSGITVEAEFAAGISSEIGRREYVMVALLQSASGLRAFPTGKGSGAVTSYTQADGFVSVDELCDHLPSGTPVSVTMFEDIRAPDLTVIGSHCTGLETVFSRLEAQGLRVRLIAVGSQGGLKALSRGEADIAPIHLLDPGTETYNAPFLGSSMRLIQGWERMQGFIYRPGDKRFEGRTLDDALRAALDSGCQMVNRNAGSGTRIVIDRLLGGKRPPGYANAPRSHNAVAAAIAQDRADWGIAIASAAHAYRLESIAVRAESFDFAVSIPPRNPEIIAAFESALADPETIGAIEAQGFRMRRRPGHVRSQR